MHGVKLALCHVRCDWWQDARYIPNLPLTKQDCTTEASLQRELYVQC